MKRRRIASFVVAGSATVFQIAVPVPGCESMVFDPQAFFAQNRCNIFNCDTLFFLQGEHDDMLDDHNDSDMGDDHDQMEMDGMNEAGGDEHQH